MSKNAVIVTVKNTKMGWCLFVNGEAYALGSRDYCITVANGLRKGGAA